MWPARLFQSRDSRMVVRKAQVTARAGDRRLVDGPQRARETFPGHGPSWRVSRRRAQCHCALHASVDLRCTSTVCATATCLHPEPLRISGDRKSTRLNSSHGYISYAVFCLKKKKKKKKNFIHKHKKTNESSTT